MGKTGVLLTGFGGPDCLDSVQPFMCNLMGREPSDELVERVRLRYLTIGGASPLVGIATAIAEKLQAELADIGKDMPVGIGMSYWHPYIEEGLGKLVELGCTKVITVSLSPFESKVSSGVYRLMVDDAAEKFGGVEIVEAPLVGSLPEFAEYLAGSCAAAIEDIEPSEGAIVTFTAHSLPMADLVQDDPYIAGLRRVAESIAEQLGLGVGHEGAGGTLFKEFTAFGSAEYPRAWFMTYQSKGNRPGEWLGPDIDDLIEAAADSPVTAIVACPIGFLTDHMETLYDLDVVAAGQALDSDLEFVRAPVPNDDSRVVEAIAREVAALD